MSVNTVDINGNLIRVAGGTLFADAPIASIIPFGGETAPAGWLICDGSTLSRTEYAELFAVIGIAFGVGDGETTFGIPDLRECVPVGAGKNITKSIANHDRYDLGQFKDDALGTHDHPLKTVTTATYNTAGVPVGVANNNTPTSATHGKQLGVNYIIKAKMVGIPADLEAQIDVDYQKKDLTTPITIGGVSRTTVEGALGAINSSIYQRYAKNFTTTHDRYVEIGTIPYSAQNTIYSFTTDIVIFSGGERGSIHLDVMSRAQTLTIQGWSDYNLAQTLSTKARIVASLENNETYHIYVDSDYQYLQINMYVRGSNFTAINFIPSASITGTEVFNSTTNDSIQYLEKLSTKADKVTSATNGDLASLDANGNLVDSNIAYTSVMFKAYATHATLGLDVNSSLEDYVNAVLGLNNGRSYIYKSAWSSSDKIYINGVSIYGETAYVWSSNGGQFSIFLINSTNETFVITGGRNSGVLSSLKCNKLVTESNLSYSTSETNTGKTWIDGKPIYRKVVDCGTLPNNTIKYVPHGISNLSKVVSLTGMASNASYSLVLPHVSNSNFSVEIEIEGANIDISVLSDMSGYTSSFVVIEYTKTT